MLEEQGVAPQRRIENPHMGQAFHGQQQNSHGEHRGGEQHDQAGRIHRPHEQGHAEPGHARRAHAVDGDDDVQAGED